MPFFFYYTRILHGDVCNAHRTDPQCTVHTHHTHTWIRRIYVNVSPACVRMHSVDHGALSNGYRRYFFACFFFFVCLSIFFLLRMMYRSAYKQRQQQQVKAEVNAGASQICAQRQYCNIFIYIDSICAVRTIFDLFIFLLMLVVDDFFFVFVFSCNAAIFGVHIFIRQLKGTSKRSLIARPQTNRKMFHFTTTVYTLATNK